MQQKKLQMSDLFIDVCITSSGICFEHIQYTCIYTINVYKLYRNEGIIRQLWKRFLLEKSGDLDRNHTDYTFVAAAMCLRAFQFSNLNQRSSTFNREDSTT